MASPKNGAVVAEKTARVQIPKRIRSIINDGFGLRVHNAVSDEELKMIRDEKKEVLAYVNGLLKQLHP